MTIAEIAEYPLKLIPVKPPFTLWEPPTIDIPRKLYGFFEVSAWSFQLFIYRLLIEERFGPDAKELVEAQQLISLKESYGPSIAPFLKAIEQAYDKYEEDPKYPFAACVAAALLSLGKSMTDEQRLRAIKVFHPCLAHAKDAAILVFKPAVDEFTFDLQHDIAGRQRD